METASRDVQNLRIRVAHQDGQAVWLEVIALAPLWALTIEPNETGGWHVRTAAADMAETVEAVTNWGAAFDMVPETVEGLVVRAEVAEVVDRNGQVGVHARSDMRTLLTRWLDTFETSLGEHDAVAWLSEEAGKRGFRLQLDTEIAAETGGGAVAASFGDPDRDPT